jgi:hypothetical protein
MVLYSFVVTLLALAFLAGMTFALVRSWEDRSRANQAFQQSADVTRRNEALEAEHVQLRPFRTVADADLFRRQAEARTLELHQAADAFEAQYRDRAKEAVDAELKEARAKARALKQEAEQLLATAAEQQRRIIRRANRQAEEIAGKAYAVVQDEAHFRRLAEAMKNVVDGYGDRYLIPADSFLDDLAEEYSHKEAGRMLKLARQHTKKLVEERNAARCEYVERNRREAAEHFVVDAFNGKVDSILSRVKHDNAGTLEQEIRDAFTIVNHGGQPFRNARVLDSFRDARLDELKWAAIAHELRRQEREEQRRIRERIREEERARREYERAIKEAAKQEKALRKAVAEAEARINAANAAEREQLEAQLAELSTELRETVERNLRATSMAQHTKRGHVYVISNVGSFGEEIYKVGLTRRLEPLDRIKELGDASVPFEFDVHAMIFSDDAPALEHRLHKLLVRGQVNKVNHRKEFFRASLTEIRNELEAAGVEAKWTMKAEAQQYRETLAIERAIADDPEAFDAWMNRQLELDAEEAEEEESAVAAG